MPFQFKPLPQIFPDQRLWGCAAGPYTFVISEEEGRFTASAKPKGSAPHDNKRIDLGGYAAHETFDLAQQACIDLVYRAHN